VNARTPVDVDREAASSRELEQFAADVGYYLVQDPRQLPSRYLYDALGSALFEAICQLPWYEITRAESRLLAAHSADIFRRLESLAAIIELGPGSGEKLRTLLLGAERLPPRLDVHLVDVSPTALQASRETLGSVPGVRVIEHAASYEAGLEEAARHAAARGRSLVLFLGSNIGNFDPPGTAALLGSIRQTLTSGDALLLGADLVKPAGQLRLAYDDPLGVTAAFNRNLLVRINRELRGNFAIEEFAHEAVWNADASRVEMHLVARSAQHVEIPGAGIEITLEAGERIWTESSYKYHPDEVADMLGSAGFRMAGQWIHSDGGFALTLGITT
jgi:L-histidine N-alpha-methyltransferase